MDRGNVKILSSAQLYRTRRSLSPFTCAGVEEPENPGWTYFWSRMSEKTISGCSSNDFAKAPFRSLSNLIGRQGKFYQRPHAIQI